MFIFRIFVEKTVVFNNKSKRAGYYQAHSQMTDAGFFKGTSADQDSRFSDKNKKLMKTMKFAENLEKKVKFIA